MGLVCSRYPCLYPLRLQADLVWKRLRPDFGGGGVCKACAAVWEVERAHGRPLGKARHDLFNCDEMVLSRRQLVPATKGGWRRDVSSPQCWLHSWFCCRPTRPMTARKDTLPTFTKWTCQYEYEAPSRTVGPGSCCGLEARAATRLVRATLHRMPIRATARQRWALRCRTILA